MKRILVTGFEAFGNDVTNPTELLVRKVAPYTKFAQDFGGADVRGVILPVTFRDAFTVLERAIVDFDPDVVLAFGLARGRTRIEVERVAINCIDAEIPDNSGSAPRDQKISVRGDVAFFSTLPVNQLVAALQREGLPAGISNSAGTYVCNYLFYRMQEASAGKPRLTGFIHVPASEGDGAVSIDDLARALGVMVSVLR